MASKIEYLERQLKKLRLQIETNVVNENSGTIQEGNRVDILNPRKGQEREGIIQNRIRVSQDRQKKESCEKLKI